MTFWAAAKESFLELLFGANQLQAWRDEKKQREECERIAQEQYAEYRRLVAAEDRT